MSQLDCRFVTSVALILDTDQGDIVFVCYCCCDVPSKMSRRELIGLYESNIIATISPGGNWRTRKELYEELNLTGTPRDNPDEQCVDLALDNLLRRGVCEQNILLNAFKQKVIRFRITTKRDH